MYEWELKVAVKSPIYLFIVIMAMQSNETPTLPYCKNGMSRHKTSPWVQVPWMKRNALNGRTIEQNTQSAMHKLKTGKNNEIEIVQFYVYIPNLIFKRIINLPNNKCGGYISYFWAFE